MKAKLTAIMLAAGAAFGAWADELTVHDGTATNGRIPFDGYGSAVVKGAGPAEVTVEACNTCTR